MPCNKATYPDKKAVISEKHLRERHGAPELRYYHCPICRGWHLSKVKFWKKKHGKQG
jgi:hypothetical protein